MKIVPTPSSVSAAEQLQTLAGLLLLISGLICGARADDLAYRSDLNCCYDYTTSVCLHSGQCIGK